MISDSAGQQLHHRATAGERLSPEEQAQLADWYQAKDQEESLLLLSKPSASLAELQANIDLAVKELTVIHSKNVELRKTNAALQAEIDKLKRQLAAKTPLQPA